MEFISSLLNRLLSQIDCGKFFIVPMRWLYILLAWINFLAPLALLYYYYQLIDSGILRFVDGWPKMMGILFCVVFFILVLALAYGNYLFWQNRCAKLDKVVSEGEEMVAIPLISDLVKSLGEIGGINMAVVGPSFVILVYLFAVLTGVDALGWVSGDKYVEIVFKGLLIVALYVVVSIVIGFLIVLLTRFLAEQIRLLVRISNDVRDLGDIHRAATMDETETENEAEETAEVEESEEV